MFYNPKKPQSIINYLKNRLRTISPVEIFIFLVISSLIVFIVKYYGLKKEYRVIRVEVNGRNWSESYDSTGYRTPFWLSDKIKLGAQEIDKSGIPIATLVDLENYDRGQEESEVYLTLKVQTVFEKKTGRYLYKDRYLDVGSPIELILNGVDVIGQITDNDVPARGYPTKYFIATLRGRNLEPWLISQVKIGDKFIDRANQQPAVEIIDVKTEDPAAQPVKIDTNNFLQITRNQNKDVVITAKIKSYFLDGRWYYAGHQNLKIGNLSYFYTNKYNLYGLEVQDVKEIQ